MVKRRKSSQKVSPQLHLSLSTGRQVLGIQFKETIPLQAWTGP
jgi:hypothetical protein